jgi:putative hydrolase of the HAD superfamily
MAIAALLFDLGDTIMMEETEFKDENRDTLHADLVPGIDAVLRKSKKLGIKLGLVADTRINTYKNVLKQHNLYDLFDAFAISDEVGCEKPDPRIFHAALSKLVIESPDYERVIMIGNNPA